MVSDNKKLHALRARAYCACGASFEQVWVVVVGVGGGVLPPHYSSWIMDINCSINE